MDRFIGIDIGSTCTKTVVLDECLNILSRVLCPTGWSSVDTAQAIRSQLFEMGVLSSRHSIVATGYGRISVPYADKTLTEITCHAKGACFVYKRADLTVIDIGGQDTKLIAVENGSVKDFVMNDKCSAGTGRFLEVMANTLSMRPEELCALAESGGSASISSMCTVFAESEVIGLIGRGEPKENIAYAVIDSIVKKVVSQASKFRIGASAVCLTGGLCTFDYLRRALSQALSVPVLSCADGRYSGAIGAALSAPELKKRAARL